MSVYTYPACFLEEPEGGYSVIFQESLTYGGTCGDTLEEAMEMAKDCLGLVLEDYIENDNEQLPKKEELSVDETIKKLGLENQGYKGFIKDVIVDYELYIKERDNNIKIKRATTLKDGLVKSIEKAVG